MLYRARKRFKRGARRTIESGDCQWTRGRQARDRRLSGFRPSSGRSTGVTSAPLAPFGSPTKRSLAGAGQFFMMGLVGLILASIVGIFWHSDALQFLISVVGVIVFTGLTAWDAQRLRQMALALAEGQVGSYAIVGALSLYLDFINLFLMLLRFTGRRD